MSSAFDTAGLKIGKVVYVITKKTQTILPVIIKEKNICESIDGERVTFKVLAGEPSKGKVIDLAKIDSEVFGSIDDVKTFLVENFEKALDLECSKAENFAKQWYGHLVSQTTGESLLDDPNKKIDAEDILNELSSPTPQRNNYSQGLQQVPQNADVVFVEMPDGTLKPLQQ